MADADARTLAAYARRAEEYRAMAETGAAPGRLKRFIAALPPRARVLDWGCGSGNAARHLAAAGLSVDAVDASPEMVALAGALPGVNARRATFDEALSPAAYHGIWADFSLLHAPRAALPRHLAAAHAALRPGGWMHIGMKTGTGAARDRLGRLYTYVTEPELRDLLRTARFTPRWLRTGCASGLAGTPEPMISVQATADA